MHYKARKMINIDQYKKFEMLFQLNCLKGTLFIKSKLVMIEIAKKKLIQDIEKGKPVVIPKEL